VRTRSGLQTQSGPPVDDGCKRDGGGKDGGELVVAGGDASPILEATEHVFDEVALATYGLVERIEPLVLFQETVGSTTSSGAATARHRIHAFDALGAHAEKPVIGDRDEFVLLGARPDRAGDVDIGRVNH
jgi:hypothetical protein